jgi:hypothetical protein
MQSSYSYTAKHYVQIFFSFCDNGGHLDSP